MIRSDGRTVGPGPWRQFPPKKMEGGLGARLLERFLGRKELFDQKCPTQNHFSVRKTSKLCFSSYYTST